jgi:hypothetical protein
MGTAENSTRKRVALCGTVPGWRSDGWADADTGGAQHVAGMWHSQRCAKCDLKKAKLLAGPILSLADF